MKISTGMGQYVSETAMACGWSVETGVYALARVLNEFAAKDTDCLGVEAHILIPPHADHAKAYGMEKSIRRTCLELGVELCGAKITKNPLYRAPVAVITGAGQMAMPEVAGQTAEAEAACNAAGSGAGQLIKGYAGAAIPGRQDISGDEIVLVKWAGMEGMLRIMEEKADELGQRFAQVFLRQIWSRKGEIFAGRELETARTVGVTAIRQITEGGIFAALWELAKETGTGLEVDLKKISILQETIEVCEYYRLNPYQLASAGSFLLLTRHGEALADALRKNQTEASVIGRLVKGNDKIIYNGGDMRCLDRPAPDEIYKICQEQTLITGG